MSEKQATNYLWIEDPSDPFDLETWERHLSRLRQLPDDYSDKAIDIQRAENVVAQLKQMQGRG